MRVIGEALVDVVRTPGGQVRTHPGGSPANVAVGLARPVDVELLTRFGAGDYGELIGAHLAANAVRVNREVDAPPTSVAEASVDECGQATYDFRITWTLNDQRADEQLLAGAPRCVHTGSIAATLRPGADTVRELIARSRRIACSSRKRPSLAFAPLLTRWRSLRCSLIGSRGSWPGVVAVRVVRHHAGVPVLVPPVIRSGGLRRHAQPTLTVGELVVRPWESSDASSVAAAYRDPGIQRWHVRSMTDEEAVHWVQSWADRWEAETGAGWAIIDAGALAGRVGFRTLNLDEGFGEAAYWVVPNARGRSIAARTLTAITEWMFGRVGFHRMVLTHSTHNEASCRVAAKSGYAYEGTQRKQALHTDGWHDMHMHARLHGEMR